MRLLSDPKKDSNCDVWEKVPLRSLTSWFVGGVADCLVLPKSYAAVGEILKKARGANTPLHILGGGSNTLIADEPLRGIVLHTVAMSAFTAKEDRASIVVCCEAGTQLRSLFTYTVLNHLSGMEFAVGIPGSVGGALMGNAGVADQAIGESVEWVETAHEDGSLRRWKREELRWGYRYSSLAQIPGSVIVRCALRFVRGDRVAIREKICLCAEKKRKQPLSKKTAGCVFKNPPGDSAGRLLELAGCKELSLGDARVSPMHANFIENRGGASARDIFNLAESARARVQEKLGVLMEYEVKFIGDFTAEG